MQEGDWKPQHTQRKGANQTTKEVGENNALVGCGALWRTRKALVQHLVKSIQHTANTNDEVAECAVLSFLRRRRLIAAGATSRFGAVFSGRGVAICDDEDAGNGHGHGNNLACADFFVENGDAEGVGEEGRAIVNGSEVTGCGLVDGHVPTASGECKGACNETRHLDHVSYGRDLGLARRGMQALVLDHEGGLAQELDMAAPEGRPWLVPMLEA